MIKYALLLIGITHSLIGYEVVFRDPQGDLFVKNTEESGPFEIIVDSLQSEWGEEKEFLVDFKQVKSSPSSSSNKTVKTRDYKKSVSASEKEDISYVVNTLGMSPLSKIATSKSSLKKAGKRIENIHPLKFLLSIFSDDKTRASIHAMRDRTWVWEEFFDGLRDSLTEESGKGNLTDAQIQDFSSKLGIDANQAIPILDSRDWNQFIKFLLKELPRGVDSGRYDM